MPIPRGCEQLSDASSEDYRDFQYDEEEEVNNIEDGSFQNQIGIRWEFRDDAWRNPNILYDSMPFSRLRRGSSFLYNCLPTFITLFKLFWTLAITNATVMETNRYATTLDALGRIGRGPIWEELIVDGLKAFMATTLYMGMKRQPNYKSYWMKDSFFHCSKISSIFSHAHFIKLHRCLHLTDNTYIGNIERGALGYDKLHQTR